MKDHPLKTVVQAEASALLAELLWVNPSCIDAIVEAGCFELVLYSMQRHGTNIKVQQMSCGFFRAMSYDFVNHQHINKVDGVAAVIGAMKRNQRKYDVLRESCYFLQNILCNPGILPETIELIVTKGTIPLVIDAMMDKCDARYLEAACGVLANLAIDENARQTMGDYEPSIPTLLSVIESGIDMDACKCSLNALSLLAKGDKMKAKMVNLGVISTLMSFLSPINDVSLLDSGLRLLLELSENNEEISQQLLDSGGQRFVVLEMSKNVDSSHIQARACGILGNLPLAFDKVDGATSLILAAMGRHKEDSAVQFEGSHALLKYCCRYPLTAKSLKKEDYHLILARSRFQLAFAS